MNTVVFGLDIATAATAFTAAVFWFQSAHGKAPPMTYDKIDDVPKFLNDMSKFSRWGALFAGLSASLAGIRILIQTYFGSPSI